MSNGGVIGTSIAPNKSGIWTIEDYQLGKSYPFVTASVLAVGGGGNGGNNASTAGGGGGAGGFVTASNLALQKGTTYTITVGSGGGNFSSFGGFIGAAGGGNGGNFNASGTYTLYGVN